MTMPNFVRVIGVMNGVFDASALGGGERTVLEVWTHWLRRSDISLLVLTTFHGEAAAKRFGYVAPFKTAYVPKYLQGRWAQAFSAVSASFLGLTEEADIVVTASVYFYDVLPAILIKLRNGGSRLAVRVPHILLKPSERPGSFLLNLLSFAEQRLMLAFARCFGDVFLVDNRLVREGLGRLGIESDRIEYVPQGIRKLSPKPVNGAGTFVAIYVGRRSVPKGVPELLESWRLVVKEIPGANLALVGYEDVGFQTEARIRRLELSSNIRCFQGLDDAEVAWMVRQARVAVIASREEGYGRVIAEAMAAKRPVVTYDVPAFSLFFNFGRAVSRTNDSAGLAAELVSVLTDERRYAVLQNEIEQNFQALSWEDIANDIWTIVVKKHAYPY